MKAKKLLLISATLGLATVTAQAQSTSGQATTSYGSGTGALTINSGPASATLYGLIDVTLVNANNQNTTGGSVTAPRVAWFSGNRWGITGERKLGGSDNLKAIFRLESEFESETGNMDTAGTIFNRDSWVGFHSDTIGKLTIGRQNALARDPAASAVYGDPYGSAKASEEEGGYSNNNNFKQLIFYAGSANGTRVNNGVTWKKAFSNGFVGGAQYSFGGVVDSFNTGSTTTGSLAYNGSNWTVAGFATSANIANMGHKAVSIGGNIQINELIRVNAGLFNYTAQQAAAANGDRTDNAWTISTKLTPAGKMDYQLGYQVMHANNAMTTGANLNVANAFADTSGAVTTGTGNRSTLYGSIFYHFDSATEVYVAFDQLNTTDTYKASQANGNTSANEYAVGMRYKF